MGLALVYLELVLNSTANQHKFGISEQLINSHVINSHGPGVGFYGGRGIDMKKCTCGNDKFYIEIKRDCYECDHNGAWNSNWCYYTLDLDIINDLGLTRNQAENEGECELGHSYNNGCHMYKCTECGRLTNLPLIEG